MQMPSSTSAGPLKDLKVLELGHFVAAPFATRLLGDLGADVIKIEPPGGDPVRRWGEQVNGSSLWWSMHGRNKQSVALDLKAPTARDIVLGLVADCDVLVENFRPGHLAKLGLGLEQLRKARPDLIVAQISGYGQDGPYSERPAFGVIGEAVGGLRYLTNKADPGGEPPVRVGVSIGDSIAGLYAAFGLMAALWARDRAKGGDGRPRSVDIALTEAVLSMMEGMLPEYGALGKIKQPTGSAIATAAPSNAYPTADGSWILIAANSEPLFAKLAVLIGQPAIAGAPQYRDNALRVKNAASLDALIAAWTASRTAAALVAALEGRARLAITTVARDRRSITLPDNFASGRGCLMSKPGSVSIVEVGPRDGFQPIVPFIPTAAKIEMIRLLHEAGLRRIEVGSFASARAVPQLADAPEIAAAVAHMSGLDAQFLAPNQRCGERALEAGVRSLAFVISASAAHNHSNVRREPMDSANEFGRLLARLPPGVKLRLNIATAFDCPFGGPVAPKDVLGLIGAADGAPEMELCLCDTTGRASPSEVERLFALVRSQFPHLRKLAFHGHDTYGLGLANVVAAWRSGVEVFDAAVAGLGGCPFAPGATGNVATEDLAWMFARMGVETGIDLELLLVAAESAAALPGASPGGRARQALRAAREQLCSVR